MKKYSRRQKPYINLSSATLPELEAERNRAVDAVEWAKLNLADTQKRERNHQTLSLELEALRNERIKIHHEAEISDKRSLLARLVGISPSENVRELRKRLAESWEKDGVLGRNVDANPAGIKPAIRQANDWIEKSELHLAKVDFFIRKRKDTEDGWIDLRNKAAQNAANIREAAHIIKERIRGQHCCPYCGGSLGGVPHADHIYPVSKGGRSTERNMVYVCSGCNKKKSDLTLTAFVRHYNLDREVIEERLRLMEKDF